MLARYPAAGLKPGESFVSNDPYKCGSPHAPDFVAVTPAFHQGVLLGFGVSLAHKSDIGGLVPGSSGAAAREIYHDGLLLPPAMDGVPGVSFAGIGPGETFVYRFPVVQSGTYWCHSHSGGQELLGLYAPLIIEPAAPMALRLSGNLLYVVGPRGSHMPTSKSTDLNPGTASLASMLSNAATF